MSFKVSVVASLLIAILLMADCKRIEDLQDSGRSARWEAYTKSQRQRRDTPTMEWQRESQHSTCTLQDITTFDARQRRASGLLATPQRQGDCGSCWAFASTNVFSDYRSLRMGSRTTLFSTDYLTKCISPFRGKSQGVGNGCCGGNPRSAFSYLQSEGTVSGTCQPYTLTQYSYRDLDNKRNNPLMCPQSCVNPEASFNPAGNRIPGFASLQSESEVIAALDDGRPVYARMKVKSNFVDYRCGVFCDDEIEKTNHAVEVVDYSNSNYPGSRYWVVKNSWGTSFGEGGYFRIARGRRQLIGFVTISASPSAIPDATDDLVAETCNPQVPDDESDRELIQSAVEFAVGRLNNQSEIRCADGNTLVASLSLSSFTNGTVQVIEGFAVQATVEVEVEGCSEDRATITITVMIDLDDNFSLVESEDYTPVSSAEASGANLAFIIMAMTTMLAITS